MRSRWPRSALEQALAHERRQLLERARAEAELVEVDGREYRLVRVPSHFQAGAEPREVKFHRKRAQLAREGTL